MVTKAYMRMYMMYYRIIHPDNQLQRKIHLLGLRKKRGAV